MRSLLIGLLLICISGCYHILPPEEIEQHSTELDILRTANKTIDALLSGKIHIKCLACELFVETAQILIQLNASENELMHLVTKACILLQIEDVRVCTYVTKEFRDEFIAVVAKLVFHPAWLCYAAVGPSCGEPPDIFDMWNVTVPPNKPEPEPLHRPPEGLPKLRVVQISDVHVDLAYKPGSSKHCNEPLCCRGDAASSEAEKAGYWGSLQADCDIPKHTFKEALRYIAQEIKPDLIFWTGDIPAHNVWNQSRADQLYHIEVAADSISEHIPGIPVFPSLGNHESSPVDSFPPPGTTNDHLSNKWLNEFVAKIWARWLPPESLPTIAYGGFYAVQYSPKLRILSLNMQYCDNLNFWLYVYNEDPGGQLAWLVDELYWAEQHEQKVIILGHIPPCHSNCLKAFSWNYYKIIDRFESTIVGQYMGHTHQDQFCMMYSEEEDAHPTSFQFISPSVTTYSDLKPSVRVYTLDGIHSKSTYRPLNAETFLFDLDRANKNNETVWMKEYDTMTAYNMTWLVPETMQSLYERFKDDKSFFDKTFYKYRFKDRADAVPSDEKIYRQNLCEMITGRSHDPDICKDITLSEQMLYHQTNRMC